MIVSEKPVIELTNGDCITALRAMKENQFDLAIVDPPYGKQIALVKKYYSTNKKTYKQKKWDMSIPDKHYFEKLARVSKNYIIWGANFFIEHLNFKSGWIVYDKLNGTNNFADCELAGTSFEKPVRKFNSHHFSKNSDSFRFHPTQKPIALYKWLLKNYAKPGNTILDTHGGSMSIAIACYDMGFDLVCYELDKDYYQAAVERLQMHMRQKDAFKQNNINTYSQTQMF